MRNALVKTFARLRKDEKGVTLVEYGIAIILALVVGGGSLIALAGGINGQLDTGTSCMTSMGTDCGQVAAGG